MSEHKPAVARLQQQATASVVAALISTMSWELMRDTVQLLWEETKRRNPLFVNFYGGYFQGCREALDQIVQSESDLDDEPVVIEHHPNCNADYPEKVPGEAAQQINKLDWGTEIDIVEHFCVDCGAYKLLKRRKAVTR